MSAANGALRKACLACLPPERRAIIDLPLVVVTAVQVPVRATMPDGVKLNKFVPFIGNMHAKLLARVDRQEFAIEKVHIVNC
jgi:hypothetical protein